MIRLDSSGPDALEQLQRTRQRTGVVLVPANVNEHLLSLARRTGVRSLLGAENVVPTAKAAFEGGSRPGDRPAPLPVPEALANEIALGPSPGMQALPGLRVLAQPFASRLA